MEALDALMTTRAMRRYSSEPVTDEDIRTCLRAAQQAPSGGNIQPQQYLVVTDADLRTRLAALYRSAFDRYERTLPDGSDITDESARASWERGRAAARHLADHLADAPVLVLFLQPRIAWGAVDDEGPMDIGRLDASVYPAVQNFCVAARSLGLGTALTTVIRIRTDEVMALLDVPAGRYEIAALTPLGHPTGRFGVAPRRAAERVTHWNRWGGRREPLDGSAGSGSAGVS